MIKLIIVDPETGDTQVMVKEKNLVKEVEKRGLKDKWFFIDGTFAQEGIKTVYELAETGVGISEIMVTEPLIGG